MSLAAPVEKDGFSYAGDSLYCETSSLNRHRRATLPELKAHYTGKDTENRPAHWYEAQLLHYGLPPSKVKGTAHKRLFDAVRQGDLSVPAHIQKIEADLKKVWSKKEREAKKVIKESAAEKAIAKGGTKRKVDQMSTSVNVNVSVQVSKTGSVKVKSAQPAAKKTKTTKVAPAAKAATQGKKVPTIKTPAAKAPKTPAKSPAKPKSKANPDARRSGPSSSGRAGPSSLTPCCGDEPPPYSEYDQDYPRFEQASPSPDAGQFSSPQAQQPRLGLLNGRYQVEFSYIGGQWPEFQDDLELIVTLDGDTLWLSFDFGGASGMMKVVRPYVSDPVDGTMLFWRGHAFYNNGDSEAFAVDTLNRAGPVNRLWFYGDGHIRGEMRPGRRYDACGLSFDAYRLPGQSMSSEISPTRARQEWARLGEEMEVNRYR
ncbi:hypothetical protein M406DRAFT_108220 [Cryphonectria parasitica EP155]|uniref:Uncharacterized protein n=1 Tax=Cryphonectria parasitica (strain ATCC 38755 / EP155) TaxID=660469 RepID=A0A9P4XU04_CRYP1|nr:uncharacterized protein M406DRAFT_108220 [Cryphonectria parasitica EP155]KAF3760735.1 hypothetical protein M406DRAFT_108220 [Cryphonectria parasitica EP155]